MLSNSLPDADLNLPEMKTKSPSCPTGGVHMYVVVLEHPMLHTKFQGHQPFGSGEDDFFKGFTIYGHGGHLGHVTWTV